MTTKYKITSIQKVVDCLSYDEALVVMEMLKDKEPDTQYSLEEYNWYPDAKRMGRDPDLH